MLLPRLLDQPTERDLVADDAQADDLIRGHVLEITMVAERLTLRHVADVNLDDRELAGRDGVTEHDRGVSEPSRIDDGTIGGGLLLQEVDERALVIRLERRDRGAGVARDGGAARHDLLQRRRAVDLRLTRAERVEIGPVHQQELLHLRLLAARPRSSRAASRSALSPTSVTSLKRPTRRGKIQRTFPARAFLSRSR